MNKRSSKNNLTPNGDKNNWWKYHCQNESNCAELYLPDTQLYVSTKRTLNINTFENTASNTRSGIYTLKKTTLDNIRKLKKRQNQLRNNNNEDEANFLEPLQKLSCENVQTSEISPTVRAEYPIDQQNM